MKSAAHPRPEAISPLLRALAALGVLVLLLAVVPAALVALGRALPVDLAALGPGSLLRPDDGALLLVVLLAVAWAAWAVMAVTVGLEAWSAARRVPTPRLPGLAGPQRLAAALVASLVVVLASGATTAGAAAAVSGHAAAPSLALAVAGVPAPTAPAPALDAPPGDSVPHPQLPTVLVQTAQVGPSIVAARHDTLWRLAERHLGAGERFAEIVSLNLGVPQPDGRALGPDGRIYPGWILALPADAQHVEAVIDLRTTGAGASSSTGEHVVERGESLWRIADEELGDPLRYPELFEQNRGDRQPDGRHLEDPDLILPGWVLELPSDAAGDVVAGEVEVPGDEPPSAVAPIEETEPAMPAPQTGPDSRAADPSSPEGVPDLDRDVTATPTVPPAGQAGAPHAAAPPDAAQPPGPRMIPAPTSTPVPAAPPSPIQRPATAQTPEGPATIERAASMDPSAVVALADSLDEASGLPEGGALGVLLLAGIAGELARRRRQFQRHRRPGERMPRLSARALAFEATLREHLDEADPALLERALVQLSSSARASGVPVPAVRIMRVARSGVELTLAEEWQDAEALAPFVAVDGRTWRLDPSLLDAAEGAPGDDATAGLHEGATDGDLAPGRALPGLVALGTDGQQTVLIDLAERGTLRVAGDPDLVADVLRGLTAEASFGPLHTTAARTVCLTEPRMVDAAEAGEIAIATPSEAVALLLGGGAGGTDDPLEALVTDRALVAGGRELMAAPRSGVALLTAAGPATGAGPATAAGPATGAGPGTAAEPPTPAGPATGAGPGVGAGPALGADPLPADALEGSTLLVDADGTATLLPDGVRLAPQALDEASAAALIELLAATDVPVDPELPAADDETGSGLAPGPSPVAETASPPHLLLLGEVRVEGARGKVESTRIGRLAETVAFVHLNPDSRPSALQSALWPGRRSSSQTCRQMLTRARTWLGRGEDGEPYLLQLSQADGRLRLRPEISSDWSEFQRHASAGLADPQDTEHLTAALRLVRGRPFGSVAARELPWADLHVNEMIELIVDVAHELAVRHERAGNWSSARDAALRGLRTECESEVLEAIVARLGRQM